MTRLVNQVILECIILMQTFLQLNFTNVVV